MNSESGVDGKIQSFTGARAPNHAHAPVTMAKSASQGTTSQTTSIR